MGSKLWKIVKIILVIVIVMAIISVFMSILGYVIYNKYFKKNESFGLAGDTVTPDVMPDVIPNPKNTSGVISNNKSRIMGFLSNIKRNICSKVCNVNYKPVVNTN